MSREIANEKNIAALHQLIKQQAAIVNEQCETIKRLELQVFDLSTRMNGLDNLLSRFAANSLGTGPTVRDGGVN